jgi:hypothetical protein
MSQIDLDKIASEFCSEPFDYNQKEIVRVLPDIAKELRLSRLVIEAARGFSMAHTHLCALVKNPKEHCSCGVNNLFNALRYYESEIGPAYGH